MRLLFALVAASACRPDPGPAGTGAGGEEAPPASGELVPADGLAPWAPAVLLLAELEADGDVDVEGTVIADLAGDVDGPSDDREAFRYVVADAGGGRLFERTTNGPMLVREFLGYYSDQVGQDILDTFPQLGRFSVAVPLLDGGERVRFEMRQDDGTYVEVGHYDLDDAKGQDVGVLPDVLATETLASAGDPARRLDVVLLGDGYTAAEMGQWRADAARLAAALTGRPPLSNWAQGINVHRVDVASNESGASYDCVDTCRIRDTAFGSIFPVAFINALAGTDYRSDVLFQEDQWAVSRAASTVPWDLAIVVVNTSAFGGMAVHVATVSKAGTWTATGVHEFGHLLGLVGDEYENDACIRSDALGLPRNIAQDEDDLPWEYWVGVDPDIGAWKGAYNCPDLWRPAATCMMRDAGQPFCAVCAEMLVRRLFRFTDPADDIVVEEEGGRLAVTASTPWPDVELAVRADGVDLARGDAGSTLEVDLPSPGGHEIEVEAAVRADEVLETWGDLEEVWRFAW